MHTAPLVMLCSALSACRLRFAWAPSPSPPKSPCTNLRRHAESTESSSPFGAVLSAHRPSGMSRDRTKDNGRSRVKDSTLAKWLGNITMFPFQGQSCSVLSGVPSEICAGRLCRGRERRSPSKSETEPRTAPHEQTHLKHCNILRTPHSLEKSAIGPLAERAPYSLTPIQRAF